MSEKVKTEAKVEETKVEATVNEGNGPQVVNGKVVIEEPAKEGGFFAAVKSGAKKVGRFVVRHWKGITIAAGGGALLLAGAKKLHEVSYQEGYEAGVAAPKIEVNETPALTEPVTEEMEESEEMAEVDETIG